MKITPEAAELVGLIKTELHARLDVEIDVDASLVAEMIHGCFYNGRLSKLHFLGPDGALLEFPLKRGMRYLEDIHGYPADYDQIEAAANALPDLDAKQKRAMVTYCYGVATRAIEDYIVLYNQRSSIQMRVDMFAGRGRVEIIDRQARVVFTHTPFPEGEYDPAVIDDFKEHFPEFLEFLLWVVAARFAKDRKIAYLWMHCPSDWGKGFLMDALGELGVVVPITVKEVEKMFDGGPVAKSMDMFTRAFVLFIDEFKTVRSELKQLQNEITLSPKNKLMETVEVFAKVFASAEDVPSLVGDDTIEDQFARRFNYYRGTGNLTTRPLRQRVGGKVYFDSIRNYASEVLNAEVGRYQALGTEAAAAEAEGVLAAFYEEHRITKVATEMTAALPGIAEEFLGWLISKYLNALRSGARFSALDELVRDSVIEDQGRWFLKNGSTLVGRWIDTVKDPSSKGTVSFKKQQIVASLAVTTSDGKVVKTHCVTGSKRIKAVQLNLEEDEKALLRRDFLKVRTA